MRGQTGHTSRRPWRPAQHTRSGGNQNDGVILPPYQPTEPARSGTAPRRTCPAFPIAIGLRAIRAPVRLLQQADRIRNSASHPRFAAHRSPPRDDEENRPVPDPCLPSGCRAGRQTRAIFPLVGSGGAMPVKRANAMSSTKILQT